MLRKCGYIPIYDRRSGKESFVRRLAKAHYPRFHIYVKEEKAGYIHLNVHLDMKKESYGGVSAHSGEYDTENVKQEAKRVAYVFTQFVRPGQEKKSETQDSGKGGSAKQPDKGDADSKKGFWSRLFGS